MTRAKVSGVLIVLSIFIGAAVVHAGKPVDEAGIPFGNGFPSGPHFNLNLIGKKANFTCPAPEFDPLTGAQILGNVIFIPREQGNDPITVLMESGAKGPKGAPTTSTLEVTDWCTESFPDYGQPQGDPGVLRLPANANGYAVYARITGKPGEDGEPTASIAPDLYYVEDETGNDLILLGLVDRDGTATFTSDGEILYRTSTDGAKGKGVQKATNLTPLFEWSGEVCYVQSDVAMYCEDALGNDLCNPLELCCTDADANGIYESCSLLSDVGALQPDGSLLCPAGTSAVTAECRSYENTWVFNIADFVGVLWDLDTTGSYVIQVRFYPL